MLLGEEFLEDLHTELIGFRDLAFGLGAMLGLQRIKSFIRLSGLFSKY
jgi:hypothetical protein